MPSPTPFADPASPPPPGGGEVGSWLEWWPLRLARCCALIAIGLALVQPYLTRGTIGGGDARSYATSVGDVLLQARAGVFPIWVGQSELAFHGGVFPLRVAPLLHHAVVVVDYATGQKLPAFRVLNLTLATSLTAALLTGYFCLAVAIPQRKWFAAGLAILFASCPGVLGLAYDQDLYTSFMAIPFLPVALLGVLRSFAENDLRSRLWIAGGLAGAWLAHPPIALWTGVIVAGSQVLRVWQLGWDRRSRSLDALTAAAFFVLTLYAFVSAISLASKAGAASLDSLLFQIRQAYPGNWMPLRRDVLLENLQFGYGLAALLVLGGLVAGWHRRRVPLVLLGFGAAYLVLLLPIPGLTALLWKLVPQPVLNVTNVWPMQRLIPVAAVATVFGIAALMGTESCRRGWRRWGLAGVLLAGLAWSGTQASVTVRHALQVAPTFAQTEVANRRENLVVTNLFITLYGNAGAARFASAGVMDPQLEHRFFDPASGSLQLTSIDAIAPGFGPGHAARAERRLPGRLTGTRDANPGVLNLAPTMTIQPGKKYLLLFGFRDHPYAGTLLILGNDFLRTYPLPLSGEPHSFGSAPAASKAIPLETSGAQPVELKLSFVPSGEVGPYLDFADFELVEYAGEDLPVRVQSWIPYRALVDARQATQLAIPRLLIPGYHARVDGRPVAIARADDGCIAIPLEPERHTLEVTYRPPWAVRGAYWISACGWMLVLAAALRHLAGRRRSLPAGPA